MEIQNVFKRFEYKYMLNEREACEFLRRVKNEIKPDKFHESLICNVYYDTPDYRLIRKSLEKPVYKEKLRLRSYGVPRSDGEAFLELKKKYDSVVYKRRQKFTLGEAINFIENGQPQTQIEKEISYFISFYREIVPSVYLSYKRKSFVSESDSRLRITFDNDIIFRNTDLNLKSGVYGQRLLENGNVLMEIKTDGAYPLWLTKTLSDMKIYKTSFSKYGRAFESVGSEEKEMKKYA